MRITMSILAMFGLLIAVVVSDSHTLNAAETQPAATPSLDQLTELAQAASNVAPQADSAQEATPAPVEQPVAAPEIEGDVIPKWQLHDASIRAVLRQLAVSSRRNILPSPKVSGVVSADLFDVTIYEALEAILKVNGFDYVEQGDFIYVYTVEELKEIRDEDRETMTRVFELRYIKPKDAKELISAYLSEDGKIASTPDSNGGIAPSKEAAGGMDYAVSDVIVVNDYEENLERIEEVLEHTDVRPAQVFIEAAIVAVTLNESNSLGINLGGLDGISIRGQTLHLDTEVFKKVSGADVLSGLTAGWTNSNIDFLLQAMEGITDVDLLANPKLMILNKQRGEILVGTEEGYLGRYTFNDDGSLGTQEVETLDTGTRMIVRPFVGDNGYIRLEIHPEDSFGYLNEDRLPFKSTSECTSNIMVRDGHTAIISGLFREETSKTNVQVPVLGSIPFVGTFFRHQEEKIKKQEIVILITPHVINDETDDKIAKEAEIRANKIRRQCQDNLHWFGRTKMSMRYFNWARELSASGHTTLAKFNVDMALRNNSLMQEAIAFKEEITGRELGEKQPRCSNVRYVVEQMILEDLRKQAESYPVQAPDVQIPPALIEPEKPEMKPKSVPENPKAEDEPAEKAPEPQPEVKAISVKSTEVQIQAESEPNNVVAAKMGLIAKKADVDKIEKSVKTVENLSSEPVADAKPFFALDNADSQPQQTIDDSTPLSTRVSSRPLFDLP